MAKSKNHTNHNKTRQHHKNGIDKPRHKKYADSIGVCQKFTRNLKRSRKGNLTPEKQIKRYAMRMKLKTEKNAKISRMQAATKARKKAALMVIVEKKKVKSTAKFVKLIAAKKAVAAAKKAKK